MAFVSSAYHFYYDFIFLIFNPAVRLFPVDLNRHIVSPARYRNVYTGPSELKSLKTHVSQRIRYMGIYGQPFLSVTQPESSVYNVAYICRGMLRKSRPSPCKARVCIYDLMKGLVEKSIPDLTIDEPVQHLQISGLPCCLCDA